MIDESKVYECSSKGDKRFSAFSALLDDGRSIEVIWQCDIKGYDIGGVNWRLGKGKAPLGRVNSALEYGKLWGRYLELNPELYAFLEDLKYDGWVLNDMFARRGCMNQAVTLMELLDWEGV